MLQVDGLRVNIHLLISRCVMAVSSGGQRLMKRISILNNTESLLGWPVGTALFWILIALECACYTNYKTV